MPLFKQTFTCHGAPFLAQPGGQGSDIMSGQKAANEFASQTNSDTKHIDYRSCYSANGGPFSNAQMLANKTGASVTGYEGKWSNMNSTPVTFKPQSAATACVTGAVNSALGGIQSFRYGH